MCCAAYIDKGRIIDGQKDRPMMIFKTFNILCFNKYFSLFSLLLLKKNKKDSRSNVDCTLKVKTKKNKKMKVPW